MRVDLQDVVDEVSRLLSAPATLEDRDFNLVAFGSQAAEIDEVRQHSILRRRSTPDVQQWFEQFGIATSERPVRTPASPERGVLARVCLPARWNGVTYGYLWLLDDPHHIEEALLGAAMHQAARAGAVMAQQARARERVEHHVQDLLSPDLTTVEEAAEQLAEAGPIGRDVPVAVVVLRLGASSPTPPVPMNLWRLPRSVIATTSAGDHATLVVPADDPYDLRAVSEIARQAWSLYAERLPEEAAAQLIAGIGAPRADLAEVRAGWREARLALRVGQALPELRPVVCWPEVGIHRLLACGPQRELRDAVMDVGVRRLVEHPDDDLARTAGTYLNNAGNVQRTAADLKIHRQTLYYRIQKIEKITGFDLGDGQDRLRLHLGLTLAPLLSSARMDLPPADLR